MGLKDVQYCSKMVENCFICYVFYSGGQKQYSTILEQQPITALYSGSCTIPATITELFGSNIRVRAVSVGFNISKHALKHHKVRCLQVDHALTINGSRYGFPYTKKRQGRGLLPDLPSCQNQ